jgi:hypothetical protein
MAITTKPKPKNQPNETAVQKLINKGGSVSTEPADDEPQFSSVLLRLPVDMLANIDASVKRRRPVRISRQAWIIEALHERLTREAKDTQ